MQETLLEAREIYEDKTNDSLFLDLHVLLEQVHAMPKQGVSSSFNFGRGLGLWEGLLVGIGFSYSFVSPQRWKKAMMTDMAKDKGASILRAKQLFPQISDKLKLVKDHNKAEALLLAAYGQQL